MWTAINTVSTLPCCTVDLEVQDHGAIKFNLQCYHTVDKIFAYFKTCITNQFKVVDILKVWSNIIVLFVKCSDNIPGVIIVPVFKGEKS